MDLQQHTIDCCRTESRLEHVEINRRYLKAVTEIMIAAGTMLDMIKKNTYYGKKFQLGDIARCLITLDENVAICKTDIPGDHKTISQVNPRMLHGIIGIATESAELLEAINFSGADIDFINVGEEVFDVNWYSSILLDEMKMSWDDVLNTGILKLKDRYPDKFDVDSAINRDLDTERLTLQSGLS